MRNVSAALRAAIDAGERVVRTTFTVDWDLDGVQDIDDLSHHLGNVALTQSLESSLPLQVQAVPGVAVAELTASIERGNRFRYDVPVTLRGVGSASSGSSQVTTITVPKPAGAREGDVMLLSVFISANQNGLNTTKSFSNYDVTRGTNVPWVVMSTRGDGLSSLDAAYARVEGLLLSRRVTATEPAVYTIAVPPDATAIYVGAAVNIGDQNIIGITDYDTKGEDGVDNPTSVTMPPVTVDLPGSMIVAFYAASSFQVSGSAFSPSTTDDVEQVEIATTTSPSGGVANVRMAVMTTAAPARGRHQKSAIYTSSGSLTSTLGFIVVLGPKLAGDEAQHAAWMMSELNTSSPYAGKLRIRRPVRWDLYFITADGFERVPLFTGFSTTASANSRSRTATIKALDNRENLRGTKQGDNIIAESPLSLDTSSGLPFMPGLEATWVVSKLLVFAFYRAQTSSTFTFENQIPLKNGMGYFASPLANKFSFLWAPFHGSVHPLTGQVLNAYVRDASLIDRRFEFAVGPFVAATKPVSVGTSQNALWQGFGEGYPSSTWSSTNGQLGGRIQHWVKRGTSGGYCWISVTDIQPGLGATYTVQSRIANDGVWTFRVTQVGGITRTIVGPSVPADDLWHFVGVHYDSVNGSVTFRLDNANTVVAMATWANATPAIFFSDCVTMFMGDGAAIAELQVAGSYDPSSAAKVGILIGDTWANENFTPTAFIDKSDLVLDSLPFIDDNEDAFSILSAIADAEIAAFFFDADGYPHYRTSRSDVSTTGQTVQGQFTSRKALQDVNYESGVQQIANIVSVGYTPFLPVIDQQAFSASGIIQIGPGAEYHLTITLPGPNIFFLVPTVTYTVNSAADGGGQNFTALVDYSVTYGPYRIILTLFNNAGVNVWLVDGSGQPALTVNASWMAPQSESVSPVTYTDVDSIRKYGEQALPTISGSPWLQREESAASMSLKLLSDLADARPVITNLPIKGDPTIEFGDLRTVVDTFGLGINGVYRVTGKNQSHSPAEGFTQELVVRQAATVAYWDTNFWNDGTVWG